MSLKFRVVAAFILVTTLAIALCVKIYGLSRETNAAFSTFTDVDLKALEHVMTLRAQLGEYERLQYEYNATADRSRISGNLAVVRNSIAANLENLRNHTEYSQFLMLRDAYGRVESEGDSLNKVLQSEGIDWDAARAALARMTEEGRQAEALLDRIFSQVGSQTQTTRNHVAGQLGEMTVFVIGFVLLLFAAALSIGYSTKEALAADADRRRLALFPERNPAAVFSLALDGSVLYANPSSHRLAERIDENLSSVLPADVGGRIHAMMQSGRPSCLFEYSISDHILSAKLQFLPDLQVCHLYVNDISERRMAERELHFLARHDAVTALPNQGSFRKDCEEWLKDGEFSFALLVVGFIRFEQVARGMGLDIVDELVKTIATRLDETVKARTDAISEYHLYRLSGASFAVLIRVHDKGALSGPVTAAAEAILEVSSHPYRVRRREFSLRPAVGASICPDDADTADDLLRHASAAVASLVSDNRQGFTFATPELMDFERVWIETESAIRLGMERGEFRLHYQAKVAAASGAGRGVEALIRWERGNRGLVPPGDFIPVAEDSGLIVPMGRWILDEACRQTTLWQASGFDPFTVAVNVSELQFAQEDFVQVVVDTLSRHQLPARYLELEITESLLMHDLDSNLLKLQQLRGHGVGLALDDFGTGYSSLEYLWRFPVTTLKIDRAFVRNVDTNMREQAIVKAMIDLAHNLEIKVVAEGVETAAQANALLQLGCDELQGFHFCRPMDGDTMTSWWRNAAA